VLGFLCEHHPITLFCGGRKGATQRIKLKDVPQHVGRRVHVLGWLITGKVVHTRTGEPMEFLTFEDETDIIEATFFPKTYARFCHMLDRERPYRLTGTVEDDWGAVTLTVTHVEKVGQPCGGSA